MGMREIRFRGKRTDKDTWHYGDIRRFEDLIYIADSTGTVYQVDPATVGQYTGLRDSKGREIYEGDIIERAGFSEGDPPIRGLVCWIDDLARFGLMTQDTLYPLVSEHPDHVIESDTILGNVWDNPELLGVAP